MMHNAISIGAATAVFLLGANAMGQSEEPLEELAKPSQLEFTLGAGYEGQLESDLDRGGDFSIASSHYNLALKMKLTSDVSLNLSYRYVVDDYDFGGPTGFGALNAWDDIETQTLTITIEHQLANDWVVFGGPVMQVPRENGASFSASDEYGGVVGVTYIASEDLVVGGGLGVIGRVEDEVAVFPVLILNWKLTSDLRLSTSSAAAAGGRTGIELVHALAPGVELAVGGAYSFSRFRLDGMGVAPSGVGEVTSFPLWTRASFKLDDSITLDLQAAYTIGGELKLDNSLGIRITDTEFDGAWILGGRISIHF